MSQPGEVIALTGREAAGWFLQRSPDSGILLDMAITTIQNTFGHETAYELVAPLDPATRQPMQLVIRILAPVDNEEDWERLENVHSQLLGWGRGLILRERTPLGDPWEGLTLTLFSPPRNWQAILAEIQRLE